MKMFSRKNQMCMSASRSDACFAAAVCLLMMGAISLVSIILLIGLLLGVAVFFLALRIRSFSGRKCTMA